MASRSRLRKKVAPEFTPAPTQNVVQSRPFAPPSKSEIAPTLADVQAQLDHAQHFGHHLANYAQPQSTSPIIQAKLTIGAPGDKYEQEADQVAGQVVQQLHSPQVESPHGQRSVQRESMPEEDELLMKPLADQIQRVELPDDDELQMKSVLQRETDPEEEDELQMKPMALQRSPAGAMDASADLEGAIAQARGSGSPLADTIRQPMEQAFGADFSNVTVHTDSQSDQLNRSIQAKAFTTGQDIFFRQGAYHPGSSSGQELLAHELTHVVQQQGKFKSINSARATIQRKIGFEFETTDYLPKINDVNPPRPARRKEELHQGNNFKLEGDDSTGGGSPSIEFVTSAYEISKGGMSNCTASFKTINSILKRIEKFDKGDVITSNQHQLSNQNLELTKQEDHPVTFKMQITQGIALEDLPTVMKYFGTNVPGETPKETKKRKQSRKLMANSPATDLLGLAPSLAQTAITYLCNNGKTLGIAPQDVTWLEGSQPRLLGFFAQIMMYVKALTIPDGQFQKYKMPFLGRVEMSALFKELSKQHRRILAQDDARAFTSAVVHAANSAANLWTGDSNYTANSPLLRTAHIITGDNINAPKTKVPVMQSLTIEQWLRGITKEIDWLSSSNMKTWLKYMEPTVAKVDRQKHTDLLESFNMLGDQIGTKTDTADRHGTSGLSILENRSINPGGKFMTIGQVESAAKANLKFLLEMQKKAGNPGAFPKV